MGVSEPGMEWVAAAMRGCGGDERNVWAEFLFAPDAPVFAGHFPGNPVLPAVVQMALVRFVAERRVGRPLRPLSQERSRFTGMVAPDRILRVDLSLDDSGGGIGADFVLSCGGEKVARGRVVYVQAAGEEEEAV